MNPEVTNLLKLIGNSEWNESQFPNFLELVKLEFEKKKRRRRKEE